MQCSVIFKKSEVKVTRSTYSISNKCSKVDDGQAQELHTKYVKYLAQLNTVTSCRGQTVICQSQESLMDERNLAGRVAYRVVHRVPIFYFYWLLACRLTERK